MSDSDLSPVPEQVIQVLSITVTALQIQVSGIALFVYDWIIMFPTEVTEIWMQKQTGVTVLYHCIRYFGLLQFIFTSILELSPGSVKLYVYSNPYISQATKRTRCSIVFWLFSSTSTIVSQAIRVMFILRVWAMYQRGKLVLVFLCFLALLPFAAGLTFYWIQSSAFDPAPLPWGGCQQIENPSYQTCNAIPLSSLSYLRLCRNIVLSVEMYSVISFDMVVFLFTLLLTLKASLHAKTLGMNSSLHTQLLKDGTLYFLGLTALTVTDAVVLHLKPTILQLIISVGVTVMEPLLACRLILGLRRMSNITSGSQAGRTSQQFTMADLQFASGGILANIGAPLRNGDEEASCGIEADEEISPTISEGRYGSDSDLF